MSELDVPIVVYHVATMGNWHEVIREQFLLLRECGLAQALTGIGDSVRITHVGHHLDVVLEEAARQDVPVTVVRSDPNTDHYETFAMIEIERLAKEEQVKRHILYFHTKGVSAPHDGAKHLWRRAMGHHVLGKWRENVDILSNQGRDAAGMNWWNWGDEHFSGTFWMAKADWIRRLPNFVQYHHIKGLVRFSCELWIGACYRCNAYSHGTMNAVVWEGNYDFTHLMPPYCPPRQTITWITTTTPGYIDDAVRLQNSFRLLGPGHELSVQTIDHQGPWRHVIKLQVMRRLLLTVKTTHVFWIDADCEFLCTLRPHDFLAEGKAFSAVRHLAYNNAREVIPEPLQDRLPATVPDTYWQACLWGGEVHRVREILEKLRWLDDDERGYDEHGLNIEFAKIPEQIHTLPCRFAAPTSFKGMPQYEEVYKQRSGGAPRVLHHNREINR